MDKEGILDFRTRQLAEPIQADKSKEGVFLILFRLGAQQYGIETTVMKEVAHDFNIVPVETLPNPFVGLMNLRQKIIPVVDLHAVLNIPIDTESKSKCAIVLERSGMDLAILVDELQGNTFVNQSLIEAPPENFEGTQRMILKGITADKLIILEGEAFFSDPKFAVNDTRNGNKRNSK